MEGSSKTKDATLTPSTSMNLMDEEDQENELTALESILDPNQIVYQNASNRELARAQIDIYVDLPPNFTISYGTIPKPIGVEGPTVDEEQPGSSYKLRSRTSDKFQVVEVKHLQPIKLIVTLPKNYPSSEPPIFILDSSWLDRASLSKLCLYLDLLWLRNPGRVVLFSWISFLREDTISVLDFGNQLDITPRRSRTFKLNLSVPSEREIFAAKGPALTIGRQRQNSRSSKEVKETMSPGESTKLAECSVNPGPGTESSDSDSLQALSSSSASCPEVLIVAVDQRAVFNKMLVREGTLLQAFVEFSDSREDCFFRRGVHHCDVCLTDKVGTDFILLRCGHYFCKGCMYGCYVTHITEGNLDAVKCLAHKCTVMPSSTQIAEIVGKELFERYDSLLLKRALEGMPDMIYCPRSQCGKPVVVEQDDKLASCATCKYRFCSICKAGYHGVEPCKFKSDEKQKLFDSYTSASKEEKLLMEKTYGKKQLELLVQSSLSEKYIEERSKACPHCKIPIEKFEGCNKITCTKCGSFFCWLCSQQLDKTNPYFHFQDPMSKCNNSLFENIEENNDSDDDSDDGRADWQGVDLDVEHALEIMQQLNVIYGNPRWPEYRQHLLDLP